MATTNATNATMTPAQADSFRRAKQDFRAALDQIHALATVQVENASIELKATNGHPDAIAHLQLAATLVASTLEVMQAADA
jgi:hypothetical protein